MPDHATDASPDLSRIARDLYAIYCASSGGLNFQGLPCPEWGALPAAVRGHWETVARRALAYVEIAEHAGPDAPAAVALSTEPDALTVGHLPDPAAAAQTWRRYAGLA